MSYAIIRNTKYKRENLKGIFRHNERRNKNYSNENIDKEKSYLNYSLKSPQYSYEKEFDRIREKCNLKGQIKTVSNIACEYIITSDHDYFENIGEEETKRFFETAYKFVCEYKDLGEQYILSATVHRSPQGSQSSSRMRVCTCTFLQSSSSSVTQPAAWIMGSMAIP